MMTMPAIAAGADVRVDLPRVLDLTAALGLQASILRAVASARRLYLNASQVEVMMTPGAQLIAVALRNGDVFIEQPSVAFADAMDDLGLEWHGHLAWPGEHKSTAETVAAEPIAPDLPAHEDQARPAGAGPMRILTIDDSRTMRDMLMLTLADAGFDVLQAVDGQEGVDLLEKETVDVVITDINMPRMDGYEVIRQLRARPEHQSTPILVLTTESEVEKKNIAREVGATGWLVKPFDPDRLIETVRKVAR